MKRKLTIPLVVMLSMAILGIFVLPAFTQGVSRITKEEVKGMLGNFDAIIIDVRHVEDWNANELKIKGAVREDPINVSSWIDKYPKDKVLVFYCA